MSTCRECPAELRWERTEAGGRMIPLDAAPNPAGNVVLVDDPKRAGAKLARVLGPLELELLEEEVVRYMPHHATCPKVDRFRHGS